MIYIHPYQTFTDCIGQRAAKLVCLCFKRLAFKSHILGNIIRDATYCIRLAAGIAQGKFHGNIGMQPVALLNLLFEFNSLSICEHLPVMFEEGIGQFLWKTVVNSPSDNIFIFDTYQFCMSTVGQNVASLHILGMNYRIRVIDNASQPHFALA